MTSSGSPTAPSASTCGRSSRRRTACCSAAPATSRRCGGLDLAMCGICGMVALDGGAVDERAVRAMAAALVHRGPDSEGVFVDGPVGLAARRLAIMDLARGDQPMRNEDGSVVVVQNGELYDHRPVQAALEARGHRFTSHCDTEVLPHLYEERGLGFVEGVRGGVAGAGGGARGGGGAGGGAGGWGGGARGGGACGSRATRSGSSRCTTAWRAACCRSPRSSRR